MSPDITSRVPAARCAMAETLRTQKTQIESAVASRVQENRTADKNGRIIQSAHRTISAISAMKVQAVSSFQQLTAQRKAAEMDVRRFQLDRGITRPLQTPDVAMTAALVLIALALEGMVTGVLFIVDGYTDVMTGLISGIAIAGINIVAGLVIGYFPARYIGYRVDAHAPHIHDRRIRAFAWVGLIVGGMLMAALHFGAARVRVTGSHHHIFDFETIRFWATFNDYYALALMTLGIAGGCIAVYKGRNGLSDPIPGYSAVARAARETVMQRAEDVYTEMQISIENIYHDTSEDIAHMQKNIVASDAASSALALNERIKEHNNSVAAAVDRLRIVADQENAGAAFIEQRPMPNAAYDAQALHALCIQEIPVPEAQDDADHHDQQTALDTAYHDALTALHSAYGDFMAYTPTFRFGAEAAPEQNAPSQPVLIQQEHSHA